MKFRRSREREMQDWNRVQLDLIRVCVAGELSAVAFRMQFLHARHEGISGGDTHEPVDFLLDDAWYDILDHYPDDYVTEDDPRLPDQMDDEQLRGSLARRLHEWDAGTYVPQYAD